MKILRIGASLLLAWGLGSLSGAEAASLTVTGSGLSLQSGASTCSYSSLAETVAGDWTVVCGPGARTISINPPVNGTVCVSYGSMAEDASGNWTVQGCASVGPSVAFSLPSQDGQSFTRGIPITLAASASAAAGRSVTSVDFYKDGQLLHAASLSGGQYVWDWNPTPPAGTYSLVARAIDSTGAVTDTAARPISFATNPTPVKVSYVHPDHLGTPRAITDAGNNQIVWRWDNTEPFGNSGASGGFAYNLRFPGQYFDSETGKHYNYFRDYDPPIGKYIESDPIGLGGGLATYSYAEGSPLVFQDREGTVAAQTVVLCAAAALITYSAVKLYGKYSCQKDCEADCDAMHSCPSGNCPLGEGDRRPLERCYRSCLLTCWGGAGKKGPMGPGPKSPPNNR